MELTVEIALIAAASAIGGSLIAGGLAYLGMRHQAKHDRRIRLVEARRAAYARLLAATFDTMSHLAVQRIPWGIGAFLQQLMVLQSRVTSAIGEVRIVASDEVAEAAVGLMDALIDAATYCFGVLEEAATKPLLVRILRAESGLAAAAPRLDTFMAKLGEAGDRFVETSKLELKNP